MLLNAQQALGGWVGPHAPELGWTGRKGGKLLISLWDVPQNQKVSADRFGFDQAALFDKPSSFPEEPSPVARGVPVPGPELRRCRRCWELEPIAAVSGC